MSDTLSTEATIEREMVSVALEQWHAELERVKQLQAQLDALREELRRYVAAKVAE